MSHQNKEIMPKWKKDAKEFVVSVSHHETRGDQTYLPKPVMETLGKPDSIKFSLKNGKVIITSGD